MRVLLASLALGCLFGSQVAHCTSLVEENIVRDTPPHFVEQEGDGALAAMEGHWHGVPSYAVPGPFPESSGFNFTVASLGAGPTATRRWLMSDIFAGYLINSSYQQFWVNQERATLEYCVTVLNWLYGEPSMFAVPFVRSGSSGNTSIWWNAINQTYTAVWTLTLIGTDQLHSKLIMDGAKHLEVIYTRQPVKGGRTELLSYLSAEGRQAAELGNRADGLPSVCTVTLPPGAQTLAPPPTPASASGTTSDRNKKVAACPYGFKGTEMPKMIKDQLAAKKAAQEESQKVETEQQQQQEQKRSHNNIRAAKKAISDNEGYDHCYWINPTMNFKVRWTWNNRTAAIDVLISSTRLGEGSQSSHYLAIGIKPNWPLMQGMDIALGFVEPVYGQGCVQSLYAKMNLGSPEKNPSQVFSNSTAWITKTNVSGGSSGESSAGTVEETLWVQFSRPLDSGHHNLWNTSDFPQAVGPMIAFAQGPVYAPPSSAYTTSGAGGKTNFTQVCEQSVAGYHGGSRGVYGFDWMNPHFALNDYMLCDRN